MIVKEKGFTKTGKPYHDYKPHEIISGKQLEALYKELEPDIAYKGWGAAYGDRLYKRVIKELGKAKGLPKGLKSWDEMTQEIFRWLTVHHASIFPWCKYHYDDLWLTMKGKVISYPTTVKVLQYLVHEAGILMYLKGYKYFDEEAGHWDHIPDQYMLTEKGLELLNKVIKAERLTDVRKPVMWLGEPSNRRIDDDLIPESQGGKFKESSN